MGQLNTEVTSLQIDSPAGSLDACWLVPDGATAGIVLAHGAGADYLHANMQAIAEALAVNQIASLRYNFPYMQAGKRRVDRPEIAVEAIQAAFEQALSEYDFPLFAGGHSFGGRMTSLAAAQGKISPRGLIFFSFPLHQPKKPDRKRAAHLPEITQPMLFLSGTRDDLAEQKLLDTVVSELPQAQAHWLETGNHSYVVLKRTRTNPLDIFSEIGITARSFVDDVI
ncbi:MAG: alpha/beta hydrolase [Pseudomonadales bacterium]|nr:alpha/beta hydrolase [Pseudomonadales bacterium]